MCFIRAITSFDNNEKDRDIVKAFLFYVIGEIGKNLRKKNIVLFALTQGLQGRISYYRMPPAAYPIMNPAA